ncbi:hypothetical protein [Paeniglutamicibacter sp. NPDC091659]|uniref:hypothetical protein n=1 Tax=Paeniglutamicibacter sp. NPDC091659 TaxID=3364389 RepID=UPI0037F644D0
MMRILLTLLGIVAIVSYSVLGAILMNDWAVVAASGVPLDTTIADMDSADQPYSAIPGFVFAALGILLALAWGVTTMLRRTALPNWATGSLWVGILTLGAPAYFFTSFGNMNSVGDTYADWNSEAASVLEAPLYMVSGIAFLVAVAILVTTVTKATVRKKSSPVQWPSNK